MLKDFLNKEKVRKKEKQQQKILKRFNLDKGKNIEDIAVETSRIMDSVHIQYTFNSENFGEMLFEIEDVSGDMKYISFKPINDYVAEILTMNIQGDIKWSKIIEVSLHAGLDGYNIQPKQEFLPNFKLTKFSLKASTDHSLIVYDKSKDSLAKATPRKIARNPDRYYFVGYPQKLFNRYETIDSLKDFAFIPCSWFDYIPEQNLILYDITTDDPSYCFFHVNPGIFVVDTVIAYALHTEEAKKEALEKMTLSKNLISSESISSLTYGIDKNALFGLIVGSKSAKENGYEYQPKEFAYNISDMDQLRHLLMSDLAGKYTIFDFIQVDGEKMTIGQAMIYLTIKQNLQVPNKK